MTARIANKHSELNSTQTPLGSSETFIGEWEDVSFWDSVAFAVRADADCSVYADFDSKQGDGVTDSTLSYNVTANINEVHRLTVTRRFFRLRIVNGTSAQSYLSVETLLGGQEALAAPKNLSLGLDSDAIATRPTDFADEVLIGRRAGVTHFNKFGYREGLTASAGEETIWATTGNFTPLTTASTFTITYTPANDGSTANGAKTLYFQYVDSNGMAAVSVHTLGSTGSDVTSFSGLGINRIAVSSSGSSQINTAQINVTATTGGTKQAVIPANNGTTQQAIYFVDANSDAVAKFLWINVNKISGGGSPRVTVKAYVFNRTVATRFEVFRINIDTGAENTIGITEPIGFKLSPTDVMYFVADTDTNATVVTVRFSLFEYKVD